MRSIVDFICKNWVLGAIGLVIYLIFAPLSNLKMNSADASIYLSTAQNIAQHQGFVVSYNLCQFFNTLYHPLWPYYQPLYPLLTSLFITHGGIVTVIKINILFFALSVMLIFYKIQQLIPTRFNFLFILFLIFSFNFYSPALLAWTEEFHFFCFILTFILFLKYSKSPKHLFCLGLFNGVFMLIRVAHMYNFLAYLPFIFIQKDLFHEKLKRASFFVAGFILAYGVYQLFCLSTYHVLYPEYARPGADYGMARITHGIIYSADKVGIQLPLGAFFSVKNFLCIGQHLKAFYHQMPFWLWPALFYYFIPIKKSEDGGLIALCIFQSIFTVLGYSLTFYWLPYSFGALRYSMIPYVLMSIAGWYSIYQVLLFPKSWGKRALGIFILAWFIYVPVNQFIIYQKNNLKDPPWKRPLYKDMMEGFDWVDRNLPKDILVASDEDQQGYFMHRPYVSLPPGKSYNCTNLILYNHIYAPDYYLLSSKVSDKCFKSIPYTRVFLNKHFRILKVNAIAHHQ